MGAICCLEKAWLPLQQGSSQNNGRMGQTFSKVLKREEVGQIKILEVQEGSFYWWRFKCSLELNASLYKNLHSTELQNRRGIYPEIEEAFAFSNARLLRDHEGRSQKLKRRLLSQKLGCKDHEGRSQKSKRRLLSQKLGYSETTKADLRNRRGTCSFQPCQHLSHAHSALLKLRAFC
ncbi:hypothetical protein ACFXTO_009263 [Malus domestica]